jgi:competence protein ComEC
MHEYLALPLNHLNAVLLAFISEVAAVAGGEGASVKTAGPGIGWLIIGIPLSIAALKVLIRFPRALVLVLIAAVVVPGLLLVQGGRRGLPAPSPGEVRVEMLDIGQGDAFLVRSSSGESVLVDTGPPGGGVGDAVASAGLERLDGVLLTHLDLDHIGGFGEVLDRFEVETVFFEEQDEAIRSAIAREGAAGRRLAAGDGLDLDPGRMTVLSPLPVVGPSTDRNARSLVVLLEALGHRILLTGDAESEAVSIRPGPLDVLKLAHHGSRDEGLEDFLSTTAPRVGLISAGRDNRYGHPDLSTLRALSDAGVRTYRTDLDGTVSIVISKRGLSIEKGR